MVSYAVPPLMYIKTDRVVVVQNAGAKSVKVSYGNFKVHTTPKRDVQLSDAPLTLLKSSI